MASDEDNYELLLRRHEFLQRTDRKSLFTQIKSIVDKAQEVVNEELVQRRQKLKKILEREEKIYETEFANKVKSRIDEDIKARKDALFEFKVENTKIEREFLEKKRIQMHILNCYEVREALRQKERKDVKQCQLEQILQHERDLARDRKMDKQWACLQAQKLEMEDEQQRSEDCLKQKMRAHTNAVLQMQLEEIAAKREEERQEKLAEAAELNKVLNEIRMEEFDEKHGRKNTYNSQYRQELIDQIEEVKKTRESHKNQQLKEGRELQTELQCLELKDRQDAMERKKNLHKATLEYLDYCKRLRAFNEREEKMCEDRLADFQLVDHCTRDSLALKMAKKAEVAAECYAVLRKQVCEEYERRVREEHERRENKMLENRFAHEEISRAEILRQRRENRLELDKQILEIRRIRKEQEDRYKAELRRAVNDAEFCTKLAEEYMAKGIDFLTPHANWRLLACPPKKRVPKAVKPLTEPTDGGGDGLDVDRCMKPCGCNIIHPDIC